MEFTFVRGFVLFIALIGFGATVTTTNGHKKSQDDLIIGGGAPPACPPSSGQYCGLQ